MNLKAVFSSAELKGLPRKTGWALLTPIATIAVAGFVAGLILLATGYSPISAAGSMWSKGWELESVIDMFNRATPLYLAAIAVAIGFRMNIFNIGVEGQYILAGLVSAHVGAQFSIWAPLHIAVIILTAMAVGAAWVAIPAILKVTRGVHEVISTIMMNAIGISFVAAVLFNRWSTIDLVSLNQQTDTIPPSGRMPDLNGAVEFFTRDIRQGGGGSPTKFLWGFVAVAIVIGILYHLYVKRTCQGYDLRTGGINPEASLVAGVNPKRMIVTAMLLSGAVAGLVGLPEILGRDYYYGLQFTQMIGFNGIAVALIGQNHAAGAALGALLFGFLDTTGPILDTSGDAPEEIIVIMKGAMIFTAIIIYVVVRRRQLADQARIASRALNGAAPQADQIDEDAAREDKAGASR